MSAHAVLSGELLSVCNGINRDPAHQAGIIIAALTAAGYVIVPREPTPEMLRAGRTSNTKDGERMAEACYRAMLTASADGGQKNDNG